MPGPGSPWPASSNSSSGDLLAFAVSDGPARQGPPGQVLHLDLAEFEPGVFREDLQGQMARLVAEVRVDVVQDRDSITTGEDLVTRGYEAQLVGDTQPTGHQDRQHLSLSSEPDRTADPRQKVGYHLRKRYHRPG